ncbi:pilus assembly protein [Bdellovibrio sp. HCB337]|uniref:pilus assembly protein n=1 Tax=Bdellovibrio sp. HCB337 TaxID=3394358 RepID=UPI0039A40155
MKSGFLGIIGVFVLLASNAWGESLVLKIGDDYKLPLPANNRLWVQNRKILNIASRGAYVVLSAIGEGSTNVQVGEKNFQVQVIQPLKKVLLTTFEKELRKTLGLRLKVKNHQVTISGKLYRWEDWLLLAKISEQSGVSYAMAAEIPAGLRTKAQALWQDEFAKEGLAPVPVHFAQTLHARLSVDAAAFSKYENILGPFGVLLEKDAQALNIEPVVKVEITVAEVRRDFALRYGIQWPSSYAARILSTGEKQFEDLLLNAQALEQQGHGKILASPNLLCRSGKEAEFLAGGEFPIKIANYKTQDVVWKKYGIVLKVRPKADSSGRMSIALETEVSTIDPSRTVEGIPGLLTNRISSHFDLSQSQTIALSGLIKNEEGKSVEGLPALSRIPVLGALFSSRDFKENRTELVILVRPSIMRENVPVGSQARHLGDISRD